MYNSPHSDDGGLAEVARYNKSFILVGLRVHWYEAEIKSTKYS